MRPAGTPRDHGSIGLDDAIRLVRGARSERELFGVDDPHRSYLRLAAALHPDRTATAPAARRRAATDAFVTLTHLWRARRATATGGGEGASTATGAGATGGAAGIVTLNGYRIGEPAHCGDLADLYDVGDACLLKLPRDPANNDLIAREQVALRRIASEGDPRYLPYVPRLVETFRHRDTTTGVERRGSVLAAVPGLVSLAEVMRRRPDGLDPRDAAWMWRRLLVALGLAHRAAVVHGAVLPDHVLIEPDAHGVVLVDWCYSVVDADGTVPALVPAYRDWYPAEVTARRPPGPGTDIAMATRCMTALMGGRAPEHLRRFARGCAAPRLSQRPDDAWQLLGELDDLLERLYGPRTFRPFHL